MSAPSDLFLVVDMQNRRLVSMNGSPSSLPDQFQSNNISLRVQCVNPSLSTLPLGSTTYSIQNMSTFGMRVAVGDTPEGAVGPTPLALQTGMAWDGPSSSFLGTLALNTAAIDGFLGTKASASAYFEVNLTILGTRITILQTQFTLRAVVDELSGTAPVPTDQYATLNESKALFMPRTGAPGDVLTLTSPNGLIKVELGIDNNGQFTTNIIQ